MATFVDRIARQQTEYWIKRLGRPATLEELGAQTFNADRSITRGAGATATVRATPPQPWHVGGVPQQAQQVGAGEGVSTGRLYSLLAAKGLSLLPKKGMRLTMGTQVYEVDAVEPVASGEQIAAYGLWLVGSAGVQ